MISINSMNNTLTNSINVKSYHRPSDDVDNDLFYDAVNDVDDDHLDNTCDNANNLHNEGLVSDMKYLPHFENEHEPSRSLPIFQKPYLKVITVNLLVSIVPVLLSKLVDPDFARNIRS